LGLADTAGENVIRGAIAGNPHNIHWIYAAKTAATNGKARTINVLRSILMIPRCAVDSRHKRLPLNDDNYVSS
ncbi:MAG: hypothetical protein WA740_16065, partial [Candidatus Binataceae bacterium]